jgi:uncharacterized membrane protein YcaP (DUF421 family)
MTNIFFNNWSELLRTGVIGVLAYINLVILLRITGKRTLSKMNAFDFVVTISLGSTLATILLNKDVSLAQGTLALGLLVGLQFVISWASVRTTWVKQLVTGEPMLILYRGKSLGDSLRRTRVTEDEVRAAVRAAGMAALTDADAVVLETDGSFSVISGDVSKKMNSSLAGVRKLGENNEEIRFLDSKSKIGRR